MSLLNAAVFGVKHAEKLGANEAEAFVSRTTRRSVAFHRILESVQSSVIVGLGLRVVVGKHIGYASSSSIERDQIRTIAEEAMKIAGASAEDPDWLSLPTKFGKRTVQKVRDGKIIRMDPKTLIDAAQAAIDTANDVHKSVSLTRGYVGTTLSENAVANNHGCKLERAETGAWAWVRVKAEENGVKGTSDESQVERMWASIGAEKLTRDASERALKMVKAKPLPNRKTDTIWRNDAFASVVEVMMATPLTAEAVQRKRSPWVGKIGQQVADENFTLIDDGRRPAGVGTRPFDDEGVPQTTTPLIEKGILHSFVYDNYTAGKENRRSTGNAHRDVGMSAAVANYARAPTPMPNNLIVKPGKIKPEEIIKETKEGLYVVETIGEWLSNPISGAFSATVANGFLVEEGEITKPVKGVIVSDNFFEMLKGKTDMIGSDLVNSDRTYAPTVRVRGMTVAGE